MAIKLTKAVYRELVEVKTPQQRYLVAGLIPGDLLELRPKGTRQRYLLPLEDAF